MRRSLQIHLPYVRIKHLQLNYRAILTRRPSSYFTGLHHHHHPTLARTYTCKSKFSSNIEKGSQGAISGAKDSRSEAPVMSIHLTERERSICDLLTQVCSYIRKAHPNLPPVTLRINGGWVRDKVWLKATSITCWQLKLLGLESHDVDIAIDTMMGYEFATHVNDFMSSQNQQIRSIAKIERNPDQSKHLETARMKILDYEVDLVNLRSETYSEESRIPSNTVRWIHRIQHAKYTRTLELQRRMPIAEISPSMLCSLTFIPAKLRTLQARSVLDEGNHGLPDEYRDLMIFDLG